MALCPQDGRRHGRVVPHSLCFFIRPCVFWVDKRQKVSQLAPISILASMLLGRVQLEIVLFSQESGIGMVWR